MYWITRDNENERTPTTCHGSFVQFFVSEGALSMYHYQRSADLLLGLPHNLMQYWALLLYLAHRANLTPCGITYKLGDAHIYDHPSHTDLVKKMIAESVVYDFDGELQYNPPEGVYEFRAEDFTLEGTVPSPYVTGRPELF